MNATQKLMLNALILASAASPAIFRSETAQADLRVNARIVTPNLQVEIGNQPVRHLPRPVVVRDRVVLHDHCDDYEYAHVSRFDRQVAWRLASLSGISSRQLLREKARGLSWDQIGRHHRLPRPMVRAAMDRDAYERFCAQTPSHSHGRHGKDRKHGRR